MFTGLVGVEGFEPPTNCFKGSRTAAVLHAIKKY